MCNIISHERRKTTAKSTMTADSATSLVSLTYPRTGKRGVPQQFPRRLYEMLEGEAKLALKSSDYSSVVICWSESGKAFRIHDVELFAETVLPRYFRTKKFSSFQRNLNLYGFAKVRRGPEIDMYAHPAFVRGQPETLVQLRKSTSASRRRLSKGSSDDSDTASDASGFRSVSPSPPRDLGHGRFQPIAQTRNPAAWLSINKQPLVPPRDQRVQTAPLLSAKKNVGKCRLDLLALALEREGCFATA